MFPSAVDFGIPRYLLLELLQRLDGFITGKERDPGGIAVFVEMNFDDVALNEGILPGAFVLAPPPGVEVTDL